VPKTVSSNASGANRLPVCMVSLGCEMEKREKPEAGHRLLYGALDFLLLLYG
jgi:hypothetical protein